MPVLERVLRKHPWPSQQRFHSLHARHKGFSGPVGSGKSLALVYEAVRLSVVNAGRLGLIGAPTYPMLRDVTQRAFFDELDAAGIPFSFHKQENLMKLEDLGSEIIFRSLDNPERLRGTNLAWFGIDEMTYSQEDAFLRLQARLRDPEAKELCGFGVWTPNGYDWVYDRFIATGRKDLNYVAILGKPGENKAVADTGMYEQLKSSYDERLYRQEVLGEYLSLNSGTVYYAFDRDANVRDDEFDPRFPLCWSLDFNIDHMSSVIGQVIDSSDQVDRLMGRRRIEIRILDEIRLQPGTTPGACEAFLGKTQAFLKAAGGQIRVRVYGDAAGNARQTATAGAPSDWDAVRKFFSLTPDYRAEFLIRESNPFVKDRIASVNGALKNSAGEHRLFIAPRCEHVIRDMERVSWSPGGVEIDKTSDRALSHSSDALGYFVNTEMGRGGQHGYRGQMLF